MVDDSSDSIPITEELAIQLSELTFRFSRSAGPGGQHVNRRETRVELCFDIAHSACLSEAQRGLLAKQLSSRVDNKGILHIVADSRRSQFHNRQHALERFTRLIRRGLRRPKRRRPTKPSRRSVQRRLSRKRRHSETKMLRRPVQPNDL